MRVTLADGLFVDCCTAVPLNLKLYGDLQSCSSGVFKMVHVGFYVLYYALPIPTSDMLLSMDWLHAINPWIDWRAYLLSLDFGGHTIYVLGT